MFLKNKTNHVVTFTDFGWRQTPYRDYYRGTDTYRRHRMSQHQHIVNRKHRLDARSSPSRQGHNLSEDTFVSSPSISPFREESPPRLERMSPIRFQDDKTPGLHDQLIPQEGKSFWKIKDAILKFDRFRF